MSELKELKRLLVGEEAESLKRLRNRVEDRERRIKDISEALPDVIGSGDERLIAALQRPVSDCIRTSIEREPKYFADILYPVMGPAIRAAISDAMRQLVRSIDQTIESTMSAQGLKWRWEAMRTGVPYGEVVMRDSFVFRVEQVFLVHRESGLLIDHAILPEIAARDSDAVSGMLTAIQDFVRDSFADGEDGNLREIEVGSHTVWLAHGPHAMLAAVIRGVAPATLRSRLVGVLEDLHRDFGPKLQHFEGESSELFGVQAQLESCLELEIKQTLDPGEVKRPSLISTAIKVVLGVLIISALLYYAYALFDASNKLNSTRRIIDGTPGIVVTDIFWKDNNLNVAALVDPIADVDEDRLRQVGVDPASIRYMREPYQSLEAPIVLARTRRILQIPEDVQSTLDDGILKISGKVDYSWFRKLKNDKPSIVGVQLVDYKGVSFLPGSLVAFYREQLRAPNGIQVSVDGKSLLLVGQASQVWIDSVERRFIPDEHVRVAVVDALRPVELLSLRAHAHTIESAVIPIDALTKEGIQGASSDIARVSASMIPLLADCQTLKRSCAILVMGNAVENNEAGKDGFWLAQQVAAELRKRGVPFTSIKPEVGEATFMDRLGEPVSFVEFQVDDGR